LHTNRKREREKEKHKNTETRLQLEAEAVLMSAQNQEGEEGPIKSDTRIPTLVASNTLHDKAT